MFSLFDRVHGGLEMMMSALDGKKERGKRGDKEEGEGERGEEKIRSRSISTFNQLRIH